MSLTLVFSVHGGRLPASTKQVEDGRIIVAVDGGSPAFTVHHKLRVGETVSSGMLGMEEPNGT